MATIKITTVSGALAERISSEPYLTVSVSGLSSGQVFRLSETLRNGKEYASCDLHCGKRAESGEVRVNFDKPDALDAFLSSAIDIAGLDENRDNIKSEALRAIRMAFPNRQYGSSLASPGGMGR